jgi:hypothetical protein
LIAASAQHRQEAKVAAAEERERAAAETVATTARTARLAMAKLAIARAQVEVAAVMDVARAAAAELKALRVSSTGSYVSTDDDRDNELKLAREAVRERRSGQPRTTRGARDGRVDGDHGLYRRRGSPSPDRYHGHHGIQAIIRNIGPGGGWPTLTKTNYVEWATVLRVQL